MAHKMLKRLSFNSDSPAPGQLLPPPSYATGTMSPGRRSIDNASPQSSYHYQQHQAPGYPFPTVPPSAPTSPGLLSTGSAATPLSSVEPPRASVDRASLHKTLAGLSSLLIAYDELRDAVGRSAKAERKIAKAMKELSSSFGPVSGASNGNGGGKDGAGKETGHAIIVNALAAAASMFESLGDATAKLAKHAQREYETANDCSGRFFKSVAKAEKGFDDTVAQLEGKMQKATLTYERNLPRTRTLDPVSAAMDHDRYMTAIASLSAQVNALRASHGENMGAKREVAVKEVARSLCDFAELSWRNRVDATRAVATKVGEVIARSIWCQAGMPSTTYSDEHENIFGEKAPTLTGPAQPSVQTRGPRPLPGPSKVSFSDVKPKEPFDPAPTASRVPSEATSSVSHSSVSLAPQRAVVQPKPVGAIGRMALSELNSNVANEEQNARVSQSVTEQMARPLQRSDTTASEKNFVARMKEKYSQDKAAARAALQSPSERTTNDSEASGGSVVEHPWSPAAAVTSYGTLPSPLPRSNSRVRNLAQQWSEVTSGAPGLNDTHPRRPAHKHSLSMQPMSSARSFPFVDEFGQQSQPQMVSSPRSPLLQRPAPPPLSSFAPSAPVQQTAPSVLADDSQPRLGAVSLGAPGDKPKRKVIHADVCECDDCVAEKARVENSLV